MLNFEDKNKSDQKEEAPKDNKPKKLDDSQMDKVAGGVGATQTSAPPASSDGKGG